MKKYMLPLICLLVLCLFCSCSSSSVSDPVWSIGEVSDRVFSDELQLRITQIDPADNRVTYEIYNASKDTYCYGTGADFSLEVLHKGVWHKMRHESGWAVTLELCILGPGETKEYTTGLMGELSAGTYRFVKQVSLEDSQDQKFICCEFVIE